MKHTSIIVACFFILLNTSAQQSAEVLVKEYPVLWQQTAAEYRALCYQAFNIATLRLQEIPRKQLRNGNIAIITDLDETILDNSYSEAKLIQTGKEHNYNTWKDWTKQSLATAVPGAVAFLQYAKQKGISIFYVSNRDTADLQVTLTNLKSCNCQMQIQLTAFF